MEKVVSKDIEEIHSHFQDLTSNEVQQCYRQAHHEVNRRVKQLAVFENIDETLIARDERLQGEIEDSIRNLTLSYLQYHKDQDNYGHKYEHIFDFVEKENLTDVFFEQSVTEGHPFHPMTKTKLGFTHQDVLNYAPEFRNTAHVVPVLCDKSLVTVMGTQHSEKFTQFYHHVTDYCRQHHIEMDNYDILFIHEWQLKHYMRAQYSQLFDSNQLIPLYDLAIAANPLLSFRTLNVPSLDSIFKTAINVQATSAVRNVSPASINNGVVLSKEVSRIYNHSTYHHSYIQKDLAGAHLNIDPQNANKCSYLIRETIPSAPDVHNVVCASLITKSFITDKPIVIECIEQLMTCQQLEFHEAATQFMKRYSEILLEATYKLMLEEHISLEAHMQNSTVVIKNGKPQAIYIRDFGGVRLFDRDCEIDASTGLLTTEFEELLAVFTHSVLYNHLFQLIHVLAEYNYPASQCYQLIADMIRRYNEQLQPEIDVLRQPHFRIKSLLKMRIYEDGYDYQHTVVDNPLYGKGGQA